MSAQGHALVGPSGYKVWSNCPRAVRLAEQLPEETSEYAEEGTIAHALCEKILRAYKAWDENEDPKKKKWKIVKKDLATVDTEDDEGNPVTHKCPSGMVGAAIGYAETVIAEYEKAKAKDPNAALMVEVEEDLSEWIPEGFGTSDAVIISNKTIIVIDFKYGQGVKVYARGNGQLRLYALGAYHELGFLYEGIEVVRTMIIQPRVENGVTEESLSLGDLLEWGEKVKPLARAAFDGTGEYNPGEWCDAGFCNARDVCIARIRAGLLGALQACQESHGDALIPDTMGPTALATVYSAASPFAKVLSSIKGKMAGDLEKGIAYPGFKLVAGKTSREWDDPAEVKKALQAKKYLVRDICEEPELKSPNALKEVVAKEDYDAICAPHIVKRSGKPALATEDDPRPPYQRPTAAEDFAGMLEQQPEEKKGN